jgi:hypothetical protein
MVLWKMIAVGKLTEEDENYHIGMRYVMYLGGRDAQYFTEKAFQELYKKMKKALEKKNI